MVRTSDLIVVAQIQFYIYKIKQIGEHFYLSHRTGNCSVLYEVQIEMESLTDQQENPGGVGDQSDGGRQGVPGPQH